MDNSKQLETALKDMLRLVEGLRSINVFYRIGKRPTEKALDATENADERVAAAKTALQSPVSVG